MPDPTTHDYRKSAQGWGHSIGYEPLPGNKLKAYGWGSGVSVGDFLLLSNGADETRYAVDEIRYPSDPGDQWFGTLSFAPRVREEVEAHA